MFQNLLRRYNSVYIHFLIKDKKVWEGWGSPLKLKLIVSEITDENIVITLEIVVKHRSVIYHYLKDNIDLSRGIVKNIFLKTLFLQV